MRRRSHRARQYVIAWCCCCFNWVIYPLELRAWACLAFLCVSACGRFKSCGGTASPGPPTSGPVTPPPPLRLSPSLSSPGAAPECRAPQARALHRPRCPLLLVDQRPAVAPGGCRPGPRCTRGCPSGCVACGAHAPLSGPPTTHPSQCQQRQHNWDRVQWKWQQRCWQRWRWWAGLGCRAKPLRRLFSNCVVPAPWSPVGGNRLCAEGGGRPCVGWGLWAQLHPGAAGL